MKMFKTNLFSEKLKINPIKINDLENIRIYIFKSNLSTYDIIKLLDNLYMVFIGDDIRKYLSNQEFSCVTNEGVFFYRENKKNHHMPIYGYNENLKYIGDTRWSITDVWVHDNSLINDKSFSHLIFIMNEPFSQNSLQKYIDTENYKHIRVQ